MGYWLEYASGHRIRPGRSVESVFVHIALKGLSMGYEHSSQLVYSLMLLTVKMWLVGLNTLYQIITIYFIINNNERQN